MWNRQKAKAAVLGAGFLALSAGIAVAAPAMVQTDSNFRAGPGMNYRSMGVLPGGAAVDVQGCSGGWCSVAAGAQQGYVARNLLSFNTAAVAPAPYAGSYYGYRPGPYASFSYGSGGPFDPWYDPFDNGYGYGYGPGLSIGFGVGF